MEDHCRRTSLITSTIEKFKNFRFRGRQEVIEGVIIFLSKERWEKLWN